MDIQRGTTFNTCNRIIPSTSKRSTATTKGTVTDEGNAIATSIQAHHFEGQNKIKNTSIVKRMERDSPTFLLARD